MESPQQKLFDAIKARLFHRVRLPANKRQEVDLAVRSVIQLVDLHFPDLLMRVYRQLEAGKEQKLPIFIHRMLLLAFIAHFRQKETSLSSREERRLYRQLIKLLIVKPYAFYAIARIASGTYVKRDLERARQGYSFFSVLIDKIHPNDFRGASTMFDIDELIEQIMQSFAFDEAKLPKRLQYAQDPNTGQQILSEGQRFFMTGTIEALDKLTGFQSHDLDDPKVIHGIPAVMGLLLLDGHHDPDARAFYDEVKSAYVELLEPASVERHEITFGNQKFESKFDQKLQVFSAVAKLLVNDRNTGKIFFDAYAAVSRGMVSSYDTRPPGSAGFNSAALARYHEETLAAGGAGGGGSGIAFLDLPPLSSSDGSSDEILPMNIQAVAATYVVYQCNQMMLFAVVDRIVELFMAGLLPMGGDVLARKLDDWYWKREERISPSGLSGHFTRALGVSGGDVGPDVTANTEFEQRLLNTVSCFSEAYRSRQVSSLFDSGKQRVMATNDEYCRKAARDLAANCTLYGYAGAQFAAERMGRQLRDAMDILQLPRIREIYGVSTMYQVIERVAQSEFGTTINVVKFRTMAEEVRTILEIIANNHQIWSLSSGDSLFTFDGGYPGDLSKSDSDKLFRASQHILAVNGIKSDTVQQYSQPVETPALPSIPGMGSFGGGDMGGVGAGGDVAAQLKGILDRGETPSAQQIRSMIGY